MDTSKTNQTKASGANSDYYMIDVNSKQFMLKEDQIFFCDKINAKEGEIIHFPIIASSKSFIGGGKASCKVLAPKFLGKKVVVFHKTKRNADGHHGGRGGARPVLTKLQLVNVVGGGE